MNSSNHFPWDNPRFRTWVAVGRGCQMMNQALAREIAKFGIKLPHLDILANLYRFEGMTQQELARKLLVGRSNMSMLLPHMEKKGLIERRSDAADKRVLRLSLTDKGRKVAEDAMRLQTALIEEVMGQVSLPQCESVAQTMENLTGFLIAREKAAK
ncbi:MarR family winged helix-turn-helix transcriptional regulator [Rhizobium sp. L1K21]|uniref:MarR family winged helix-turn-helix transcriptional regulator n=1 Tax=Rhizobium sp. L1K21 TaxID=2954933 RepID=UPI0020930559|nr:MarR family transcriptional regulator [Rhizobium sp. L1K21]MCO6186339.1 MarR family transcriptional regulator [Rhizobium sp. L1K21]